MRILFITSYYPPASYGWGYMQLCEEVADGLSENGHDIAVLTSTHRHGDKIDRAYPVYRLLRLDPDWHSGKPATMQFFVGRREREQQAISHLSRLVADLKPDIVFVWHAIGLPRALLRQAEQVPATPLVYYLANYLPELQDEYIEYWQRLPVHWTARLPKLTLSRLALAILAREGKPIPLKFENVICVSDYVRQRLISKELICPNAVTIHNGVDLSRFSSEGQSALPFASAGLRCLVAGRVAPEKGIHTVIDALAQLASKTSSSSLHVTILGDGPRSYRERLHEQVHDSQLQEIVEFRPPVPREEMPQVLSQYNVLILPSEYDEPLARAMQEAMAMGLLVIGTTTGGSGELLDHGRTGLAFEAGVPDSLASQLLRALSEPDLATRLAEAGKQTVIQHFDIQHTIEKTEKYLLGLVAGAKGQ